MPYQDMKTRLQQAYRFSIFVGSQFIEDDCTYRASALAFTTLLAMVPLMSVSLSILSSFPVFQDLRDPLQDFIFENFVPATGAMVQNYLQQFTAQVSRLSISGLLFLFLTAILVMVTIESSLNTIWRVANPRKGIPAFLLYWAILSLTPILLGLSIAVSSWIISMPLIQAHHPPSFLLNAVPFLLSFIGFTFLYMVVPNCRVAFQDACWGGFFAALSFELAKAGFAWYLRRYDTYQLLYGAFATVPIFFIWVYWVWIITLLGAEISYALSVHYERRQGKPIDGFTQVLLWLEALWQAQKKDGLGLALESLINRTDRPYQQKIDDIMELMLAQQLIHYTENNTLMLSRPLHQIRLADLVQTLPFPLPTAESLGKPSDVTLKAWQDKIKEHERCVESIMDIKLEDLFTKQR
ncbi:MAG: YihY family inner membrane protein [Legionellaceae bacterium]|nr:YihY family inner membrane protein [Legionellaceae bacterium]